MNVDDKRVSMPAKQDAYGNIEGLINHFKIVFEGVKVMGLPRTTLSRGEIVFDGGQMNAKPGRGKFVSRNPFPAAARALAEWKKHSAPARIAR